MLRSTCIGVAIGVLCLPQLGSGPAFAAAREISVSGAGLSFVWLLPFAGMLASLALLPIIAPDFWHRRTGLIALFWALALLVPLAARFGIGAATYELAHMALLEYVPFVILIGSLFAITGGIYIGGALHGGPILNATFLVIGLILASFVGTTGASMILIRPLIRANDDRRHNVHIVIFFIFLVSNIGGALTPLGNPPIFLGYLMGVDFFWALKSLWAPTAVLSALLLIAFVAVDAYLYRKEGRTKPVSSESPLYVRGLVNAPLIFLLIAAAVVSGSARSSLGTISVLGAVVPWSGILRDGFLIVLAGASIVLTPDICRKQNEFNWKPVLEIAKLFAGIFITIIPVTAILQANSEGVFAPLFALLGTADAPNNAAYFWLTGLLSSFLDNAPTYLMFFHAAGGDPEQLMGPMAHTLAAISAGAAFMGGGTYVGNAPNFMVKAIAEHQGVKMPSFFGFMAWSLVFLAPSFILLTFLFFR